MEVRAALVVREEKPPAWALLAPVLYLAACAGCIRSFLLDRSMDIGIAGLLVAVGLVPAFVCPAIFGTRRTRIAADGEGLLVDGRLVKINDVRLARGSGSRTARLTVETRNGNTRVFLFASYADAQQLMSMLPPVSAPAVALAA